MRWTILVAIDITSEVNVDQDEANIELRRVVRNELYLKRMVFKGVYIMGTIFLATVIGWYMVILSLFIVIRHEQVKLVTADIMSNRGLFFILAIITVILGLCLVASHNLWVLGWPVIITIFSWLVLIGGIIRLFFPENVFDRWRSIFNNPVMMNVIGGVIFIIGLYLLLNVYYLH